LSLKSEGADVNRNY